MDNATNQNAGNENTPAQGNQGGTTVNMTQDQLNELINKKYAKGAEKAKAELLSSLGVDNIDSLKEIIENKKLQDEANKSELEKAKELAETLAQEKANLAKEFEQIQKKNEINSLAAKHGIKDISYFEYEYNNNSKEEGFEIDKFIETLKESKPYVFGGTNVPKTDSSSNKPAPDLKEQIKGLSFEELRRLANKI